MKNIWKPKKQYWQMTREELSTVNVPSGQTFAPNVAVLPNKFGNLFEYYGYNIDNRHKELIKEAIEQGEEIPPRVLESYPDLKEEYRLFRKERTERK